MPSPSQRLADAAEQLTAVVAELRDRMPESERRVRGYVTGWEKPRAVALALRYCRDAESGQSLAALMRLVPERYLQDDEIHCVCGAVNKRREMAECSGVCGRWFFADESGCWAARLPEVVDGDA